MGQTALNTLVGLVIGQAFLGIVAAIGFYQVVRRHIDKEIPAMFAEVNGRLGQLHADFEKLSDRLGGLAIDYSGRLSDLSARVGALERGAGK